MAQEGDFGIQSQRFLLLLAILALIIQSVSSLGWWQNQKIRHRLEIDPAAAAKSIIDAPLSALASAVIRSRRLDLSQLATAPRDSVLKALEVLAARQQKVTPADPRGWINAARFNLSSGMFDEGRTMLQSALLRDPTNPFVLRLLALEYRAEGKLEESLQLLAQAEAYAPGFRQPRIDLTPEDSQKVMLQGARLRLKVYPGLRIENTLRLENLLRSLGKTEEAGQLLESLAGDPRADLLRAQLALRDGNFERAKELARSIGGQQHLPSRIRGQAMALLAEALAEGNDMDAATSAAARARQLAPEISDPYRALARISERRGDLDNALSQLRRAWGMAPTDIGVLQDLARIAEKTGQIADARLALERIVNLNPENPGSACRLFDFLLRNGEYMDAAMALSKALDRHPTDAGLLRRAEKLHREVVTRRK